MPLLQMRGMGSCGHLRDCFLRAACSAGNTYFGIVDGNRGHLKHQEKSAVLLTIVAQDVEGWHAKLKAAGGRGQSEMLRGTYCEHFFFEDPVGYAIEIQRFHNPEVAKLFQ